MSIIDADGILMHVLNARKRSKWCERCKVEPKSAGPRLTTNDVECQIYSSNSKNVF